MSPADEAPARDEQPGQAVAAVLGRARRAARLTQEQLAERSGLGVRTIRDLEQGRVARPQGRTVLILADALGLQGPERKRLLHLARSASPPPADRAAQPSTRPAVATGSRSRPEELPVAVTDLTGRDAELSRLRRHADEAASGRRGGVTVVSITGEPGAGKTTLAVAAGQESAGAFPDGQLFVPLGGTSAAPRTASDALSALLRSLGLPDDQIPARPEERAGIYRTLLRHRRVLLVLDDAASEEQVRPLLAGGPSCLVLVTSRRELAGLALMDRLRLGDLAAEDALRMLAAIAGQERIGADPAAAAELVASCGALPLALRIAGNRLASRPAWTVVDLVARVRDRRRRLTALTAGDLGIRAAFDVSYRQLAAPVRQVFRHAALVPGPDFAVPLIAALTGVDEAATEEALEGLADAGLAQARTAGRYQYHELIRVFADERLRAEQSEAERYDAERRMVRSLLEHATVAGASFAPDHPAGERVRLPGGLATAAYLDVEAANWTAAFRRAAGLGLHAEIVAAARAMHWYSDIFIHRHPWAELFGLGVAAARVLGSRSDEAALLNFHGWARSLAHANEADEVAVHGQALAIAQEIGDRREEAWALVYLAAIDARRDRAPAAVARSRRALALFDEQDFPVGANIAFTQLGRALAATGRYAEALAVHERALESCAARAALWSPTFVRIVMATTLLALGTDLMGLGRCEAAAAAYARAQAEFARNGNTFGVATALHREGLALLAGGNPSSARTRLTAARDHFAAVSSLWWQARTLHELARLPGQPPADRQRLLGEALALCTPLDTAAARQLHTTLRADLAELSADQPPPWRP